MLDKDVFDYYVTSAIGAEGVDGNNDNNHDYFSEDEFQFIPTADAADIAFEVENETEYGDTQNEFKINGSVILN